MHFLLTHFLPLLVRFAQGFASLELRWGERGANWGERRGEGGKNLQGIRGSIFVAMQRMWNASGGKEEFEKIFSDKPC